LRVWRVAFGTFLGVLAALAFARIVVRNRDWRDDETYYRVTLAAVPEAASLRLNLGAVYWNRMQPAAAEHEWKEALETSPESAQLLNNLGLVYANRKQNDEAIAYFRRSMRRRPNYPDAHLNLGRLYEALGKSPQAELQLRAAVALAPLSVQARNELGNFYWHAGRLREAEAQFQASAASIPNPGAFDSLGDIAMRQGRRDAAEQAYRQAIGLDDFDFRGHFGLAAILELKGRAAEAADQYRAGLSVDPRNQEALGALQRLTSNSPHAKTPNP
jgi:tetratricopeptide (TPR) repeat protein